MPHRPGIPAQVGDSVFLKRAPVDDAAQMYITLVLLLDGPPPPGRAEVVEHLRGRISPESGLSYRCAESGACRAGCPTRYGPRATSAPWTRAAHRT